jgi:hypothetical protein
MDPVLISVLTGIACVLLLWYLSWCILSEYFLKSSKQRELLGRIEERYPEDIPQGRFKYTDVDPRHMLVLELLLASSQKKDA